MKVCNKCLKDKLPSAFHKDSGKKDGLCTICADCKRSNTRQWLQNNRERDRQSSLNYYYANHTICREKRRDHYNHVWRPVNKHKCTAKENERRARKLCATPLWLTDDHKSQMVAIYEESRRLTEETGKLHHVDHIIPLKGKDVCGLHVPWNLQILPYDVNLSKSNKHNDWSS